MNRKREAPERIRCFLRLEGKGDAVWACEPIGVPWDYFPDAEYVRADLLEWERNKFSRRHIEKQAERIEALERERDEAREIAGLYRQAVAYFCSNPPAPLPWESAATETSEESKALDAWERATGLKSGYNRYKCASPDCPGYPFKASEMPHPAETCGPKRREQ